jgi:predicted alpha/beta-fold hydrolase
MKRTRRLALAVSAAIAVWLILCAVIGVVAVDGALHPGRFQVTQADRKEAQAIAVHVHGGLAEVAVTADDGAVLRAWSMRPLNGNGDAVILLHGQADNRAGMLGNADLLLRHGYAVLIPDARAHGESDGAIATYGVIESRDMRRWFEWLVTSQSPHCIDGLGDSMGGAQLLNSLTAEPGFCAVVAESAFSSFTEAAYDRLGQEFGTGPWLGRTLLRPAFDAGLIYARIKYGVDLTKSSPERAVAESRVPILLIHGLADTNLPPIHSERIKAGNAAVVLWEPVHAGHCGASGAEPEEYERRVIGWFASHDTQPNWTPTGD